MKISIDKSEHYLLVNSEVTTLTVNHALELVQTAKTQLQDNTSLYVIFEMPMVIEIANEAKDVFLEYNLSLQENLVMLLCVADQPHWHESFEEIGLVLVPTLGEAVEYIYMDQLEKQFLTESE
ncbi:MAG: hypothetical protein KA981_01345 [Bacteroidia bacterium]|nr:hypothetical protein [Bacteroidia bacterium]